MSVWRRAANGIELRVRLTPKSSRDAVEDIVKTADGEALKARVTTVPEDGKANAALIMLIAGWIGVPKSSITIASGPKSRTKVLAITGDTTILGQRIDTRITRAS